MTAINKQALREAANAANTASWGKWEWYKPHKGARGYEVKVGVKAVAQHCLKVDAAFIAAANPSTMLALLDDLESVGRTLAVSHEAACSLVDENDELNRKLEAAEKRIAELEARQGKPVMFIDGDISSADAEKLAAVIREFNEETETPAARMARIIRENPHPTNMCDMPTAGIGVKGE